MLDIYITKDGSPTLIFNKGEYTEKMHHSEGAWSETLYIYLPALQAAFRQPQAKVMSLGLGLGYNELMACAYELKCSFRAASLIHSFEILPELREEFRSFIETGSCKNYSSCYEKILALVASHFDLSPEQLREFTRKKLQCKELQLLEGFPEALPEGQTYNSLLYDAFSNKMNPELWTEEFLKETLSRVCEENSVLTTYAATGALKRALTSLGFHKITRPGFSGKRDSSFYLRGQMDFDFTTENEEPQRTESLQK